MDAGGAGAVPCTGVECHTFGAMGHGPSAFDDLRRPRRLPGSGFAGSSYPVGLACSAGLLDARREGLAPEHYKPRAFLTEHPLPSVSDGSGSL